MRRFLDFYFVFLLLVYPFIALLNDEWLVVNKVWGGMVIGFIFIFLILQSRYLTKNRFFLSAVLIFITIILSILFSREINFLKVISGFKYVMPLLLASYLYVYPLNENKLKFLHKTLFIYLLMFVGFILYRFSVINFNFILVSEFKELVWYGKSHVFAQLYAALTLLFLFLTYYLHTSKVISYLLLIPTGFFGVRSVLAGIILFLVIFLFNTLWKKIHITIILAITLGLTLSFIQPDFSKFKGLILSHQDANRDVSKMDLDSATSGRTIILNYYIDNFDSERFFIGSGMQYLESDATFSFGLHNDLFEFFFSFGFIGLMSMLITIYYLLFYKIYIVSKGINRRFVFALAAYWFAVSNTSGLLYNQGTVYIYILLFFILTMYIEKRGKVENDYR